MPYYCGLASYFKHNKLKVDIPDEYEWYVQIMLNTLDLPRYKAYYYEPTP
jgi:hypothetical protein